MKCKTVSSGYNICVYPKGIYSFNSLFTKWVYHYDFPSSITIGDSFLLGSVGLEELKVGDIKNNIILCFFKPSHLFVFSYKGEFIFYNTIDKELQFDNICKIILYNYNKSTKDYKFIINNFSGSKVNMYQYSINLDKKTSEFIFELNYGEGSNSAGSCELLLDNFQRNTVRNSL